MELIDPLKTEIEPLTVTKSPDQPTKQAQSTYILAPPNRHVKLEVELEGEDIMDSPSNGSRERQNVNEMWSRKPKAPLNFTIHGAIYGQRILVYGRSSKYVYINKRLHRI